MYQKAYRGIGMEGKIAKWYAATIGKDSAEFSAQAERVARSLPPNARVLEVAPGPGYFAIELARIGRCRVTGLDISATFVAMARENARTEGVEVDFRHGNASDMPFPRGVFDFVVCRAAFNKFARPADALQEMYRVLRAGGRALIIDLRRDAPKEAVYAELDRMRLGAVGSVFSKLTFRFMVHKRTFTQDEFRGFIARSRFREATIEQTPIGLEVTLVK
ncbi:MAG: class I SAM-dependent methyltransferase [Candidatus Acidiferrales bacterium]